MRAVLILVAAAAIHAQPAPDRYKQQLEPQLQQMVRDQNIPGLALGVIENGRLAYAGGFGVMKIGEPQPITSETLFHMASITKPFVATSVMQLWEQGKVDLDAPVTRYVPYFRLHDSRYSQITVRQMLSHISGMPDVEDYGWDKPEYDDGALERYVRSLGDQDLRWDPGTKFAYSNMAFEVLGDLVAIVSGVSFEDYVDAHILKPLGMRTSTLLVKEADPAKLAAGHHRVDGSLRVVKNYPYNRPHTPSSDLHSNIVDMARWAMANMNRGELDGHRILKASTYDVMWKPVQLGTGTSPVGISWFIGQIDGRKTISHSGGDDGFRTKLLMFPDQKVAIVFMTNCEHAQLAAIQAAALKAAFQQQVTK
jgi:CubicO group peptidase (beta-lactamase class C family)